MTTGISVTLETATEGATIYYTLDGSTPNTKSTKYTAPISISGKGDGESVAVKAIATKTGMENSPVTSITYTNNHVTA